MDVPISTDDPAQDRVRAWFEALGSQPWLTLHLGQYEPTARVGIYSALAPVSYRSKALASPSWDLLRGPHGPVFSATAGASGTWVSSYHRISSEPVEPLVIEREFHGVREDYRELSEEFRLFHNLSAEADGRFLTFDDAGNESVAAEIAPERVRVLTSLVRRYQAARQVDLLLFIDSTLHYEPSLPPPARQDWVTTDMNATLIPGDVTGRPVSLFYGTRVLPPPPIDRSGVWPYERAEEYPDFIIGVDENGDAIRHTCDPDTLANYFGANPGAPDYLTPVHFRRDVLVRYYDRPDRYSVEDGYLRGGALWGLRMDNDSAGTIIVWLGDLGTYLPEAERAHWRAHNAQPERPISLSTYRRAILGQFADTQSVDLRLQAAYRDLGRAWEERFGWPLYLQPGPGDQHLVNQVRQPLHDTEAEFEELVRTLTVLLVDSLNEAQLSKELRPGPAGEKGITKLARWLERVGYPETERDIRFLRGLQEIRSTGTAHRKGSGYEKALQATLGPRRRAEACAQLLDRTLVMLTTFLAFAAMPAIAPGETKAETVNPPAPNPPA